MECLIGFRLADWFMWMHEITLDDGTAVHAYKRYEEIALEEAIEEAFESWRDLLPQPDEPSVVELDLKRAREAAAVRD